LHCWWCHNPESQKPAKEIIYLGDKCLRCGNCIKRCGHAALNFEGNGISIARDRCTQCDDCVEVCPSGALQMIGQEKPANQVMEEIEKDTIFYDESGGGVTLSGGEPTLQFDLLYEILKCSKKKGINTAVDTSGYAPWSTFEEIYRYVDLFLYDVKLIDDRKHQKYTGVSNELILNNLRKLDKIHSNIHVRLPVIPGVNDDAANIGQTISLLSLLNLRKVSILPYHRMGAHKYDQMGKEYKLTGTCLPSSEDIQGIADKFRNSGFVVEIGG
jgi:pyruvate formate lyase activating enzyme